MRLSTDAISQQRRTNRRPIASQGSGAQQFLAMLSNATDGKQGAHWMMALMSPATTADDVDRHTAAFRAAVAELFAQPSRPSRAAHQSEGAVWYALAERLARREGLNGRR